MAGVSPTALQKYLTCPRQYEATYITKEVKFTDSSHTVFGTAMHRIIELYLADKSDKVKLPKRMASMKSVLDKIKPYVFAVEMKLACDAEGKGVPYTYRNDKSDVKCIVDAVLVDKKKETVICIDWKTGKKRDAQMQHDIIKRCAAANFLKAKRVITHFIYLYNEEVDIQEYEPGSELSELDANLKKLREAIKEHDFAPTPNGLCKNWCDVLSCEHNGKRG